MKQRLAFLLFTLLGLTFEGFAQVSVQGRILGQSDKQPIVAALVTLTPVSGGSARQAISNEEGKFSLSISGCDSAWLRVRSLGSEPYSKKISTREPSLHTIYLSSSNSKLKEVIVEAPSITQRGDTLTYMNGQFKTADDRVLADVLRRLPGVDVADNGRIMYQGKPISKFYVEGLDMMQGRYGIITNNLDVNKIASIQVLERHQPVRMLQGVERPSTAAINIRLQRSSLGAFFATIKLGATLPIEGFSNQLSLMRFARTQQNLLVTKQDNTGRRLSDELGNHYGTEQYMPLSILSASISRPPFSNPSLRFNNDWYVAFSNLVRIDSLATLNLNILRESSREDREETLIRQIYTLGKTSREIREFTQGREQVSNWDVSLDYESNRSTSYLKNKLQFIKQRESLTGESTQEGEGVPIALSLPRLILSNRLTWLRSSGRGRYEFNWSAGLSKSTQDLSLTNLDDLIFERLNVSKAIGQVPAKQHAHYQKLGTSLSLTRSIDYDKLSLQYFASAEGTAHKLATELSLHELDGSVQLPSAGANDICQYEGQLSTGLELKYKGITRLDLSTRIPLVGRIVRVAGKNYHRLNVLPSLSAKYEFNPRYSLSLELNTRTNEQDILQEARGYILSSRHYLRQGSGRSLSNYAGNSTLLLSIRYPRQGHFYVFWYNGEYEHQREIARLEYLGGLVATNYYAFSHNNHAQQLGGSANWHIKRLRLQTRLGATYSYRQNYMDIEGSVQQQDTQGYTLGGGLQWTPSKYFSANYNFEYGHTSYDFGTLNSELDRLHHTFNTSVGFSARLRLSLNLYNTNYHLLQSKYNVWLTGIKLSYKVSKSCEAIIEGSNLLNKRSLGIHRQSDREVQIVQYPMRKVEYLFSIRFQL